MARKSKATGEVKAGEVKTTRKRNVKRTLTRGDVARATVFFTLAGAGLAVSMPHLASEVGALTGSGAAAAWFTAVVIDAGMCATKAHLSANGPKRLVAWAVLAVCTALSVMLNCHAFLAHSVGTFGQVAAVTFGVFIPTFVVALSYLGSETLLGHKD
jgi:hypothetical protein